MYVFTDFTKQLGESIRLSRDGVDRISEDGELSYS